MCKIKFYHKIIILLSIAVVSFGMWLFETGCLIQIFFGIPCLTCGITRAFFAIINGQVAVSLKIHPMIFSIPILVIFFLFSEKLFYGKRKVVSIIILILILLGFAVNYIFNVLGG